MIVHLVILALVILAVVAAANWMANKTILQPRPQEEKLFERMQKTNPTIKMCNHGIFQNNKKSMLTIFLNGNASQALHGIQFLNDNTDLGRSSDFLAIEYPGYGRDYGQNTPSINRCVDQLTDAIQTYSLHYNEIILIGQSIGTMIVALALDQLAMSNLGIIRRVILITPFTSLASVASHHVQYIGSFFINTAFPTMPTVKTSLQSYLKKLGSRAMQIQIDIHLAIFDEITPYDLGMDLAKSLRQQHAQCKLNVIEYPISNHNNIIQDIHIFIS